MKLNREKPLGYANFVVCDDFEGKLVYECIGFQSGEAPGAADIFKDAIDEGFEILPAPDAIVEFDDYDYDNTNEGKPHLSSVEPTWIFTKPKRWPRRWWKEHPNQEGVFESNGRLYKYCDPNDGIICLYEWNFK